MKRTSLKSLVARPWVRRILLSHMFASYAALALYWSVQYLESGTISFRWYIFLLAPAYTPLRMLTGLVLFHLGFTLSDVIPPSGEFVWLWAGYSLFLILSICWFFSWATLAREKLLQARTADGKLSAMLLIRMLITLIRNLIIRKESLWFLLSVLVVTAAYYIGRSRALAAVVPDIKLAYIPAGEFMMGLPPTDKLCNIGLGEKTQHKVQITKGFYMGVTEVAQAQWKAVMGYNPSKFRGDDLPVENVSWYAAERFCEKLSRITGKCYRLPTEAEWEYACRAGTQTRFYFGDDPRLLSEHAWWAGNSEDSTHPVGQKRPSAFGLCDMHGNVEEWCSDFYDASYYRRSPSVDPHNTGEGIFRVVRGGSWWYFDKADPSLYQCGWRDGTYPHMRMDDVGFRVVMEPGQ